MACWVVVTFSVKKQELPFRYWNRDGLITTNMACIVKYIWQDEDGLLSFPDLPARLINNITEPVVAGSLATENS